MKIDYKRELSALYRPAAQKIVEVDVPEMSFLMVDGQGSPGASESFAEAIEALFSVAYTLKFMVKNETHGIDYVVMPLEGLWWANDMSAFVQGDRDNWKWTLLIMQPDIVSEGLVEKAISRVRKKKAPAGLARVRFERFKEGKAAQCLHVGSFADEGPAVEALHEFISASGRQLSGKHHEIYLSDFRRTSPEKLRTVIRQPFSERT